MTYKATPLTSGQESPVFEHLTRPYRWRGREGWPFDPATHDKESVRAVVGGDNGLRTQARIERMQAFSDALDAALAKGMPRPRAVQEAGRAINVQPKTARSYAAELKAAAKKEAA